MNKKLKPVAVLDNALETNFLAQVLKEEQIDFVIEPASKSSVWGDVPEGGFVGFARIWGTEEDAESICSFLQDVRESQIVEDKSYLMNGRMWRIKK